MKKTDFRPLYTGGSFVIAQEQDGRPGAVTFDKKQGFSGQMSQVEIWNTILSQSEIESVANFAKSTVRSKNRVVTWESNSWSTYGKATFKDVPLKDLCQRNVMSNQFIWPRPIDYEDFTGYCDTMAAIPPIVNKNDDWRKKYDETWDLFKTVNESFPSSFVDKNKISGIQCFSSRTGDISVWTGITRNATTGIWYTKYNPSLDFSNFELLVPSETMNCAYYKFGKPSSIPCNSKAPCGTCKISLNTVLYLKGLCTSDLENYDTKYYFYGVINNRPYLK